MGQRDDCTYRIADVDDFVEGNDESPSPSDGCEDDDVHGTQSDEALELDVPC